MTLTPLLVRRGLLAAVFCLLTVLARADAATDDSLGDLITTVNVPSGLNAETVQGTTVATLTGRTWAILRKTDDRVVGYLRHRSHETKVTLVYSAAEVKLYCVGWKIDKKTFERKKPALPEGWLENIQLDLKAKLNLAQKGVSF